MDFFQIVFKPSAERELRKLPQKIIVKASRMIEELARNPYPPYISKLMGENTYRMRVGDYRILYTINKIEKIVYIKRVKHRKDVYRKF